MDNNCVNITTITDNLIIARKISRTLVERNLISGAQISEIESIYKWEGRNVEKKEFKMDFKSTENNLEECFKTIKELHNYKCPEIRAQKIHYLDRSFGNWIISECNKD